MITFKSGKLFRCTYSSLFFDVTIVESFPKFYKEIFINWQSCLTSTSDLPTCILSNFLWFNKKKLINNKTVYINAIPHAPTWKIYFEQRFTEHNLDRKETYLLPRKVTLECYSPSFQYKVLNNIVSLKKKTFYKWELNPPFCPLCKLRDEAVTHIFFKCTITQELCKIIKFLSWRRSNNITTFNKDCHFWVPKSQLKSLLNLESYFTDF